MAYPGHRDQKYGSVTYSQNGEDILIMSLFAQLGIERPSYLDLGAHHPFNISNTALLYANGSRGVNVEANSHQMKAFEVHRPEDINVLAGVVPLANVSSASYLKFDDFSGRNTFCEQEAREFAEQSGMRIVEKVSIPCMDIDTIRVKFCDGVWPNFLNCDIEGLDVEVMNEARFFFHVFSDNAPDIVCVEVRNKNEGEMFHIMRQKGFFVYCRMGDNIIFANKAHLQSLCPWL